MVVFLILMMFNIIIMAVYDSVRFPMSGKQR